MNAEVVLIGNPEIIRKRIEDYLFVEKENVFVGTVPSSFCKTLFSDLSEFNIIALKYSDYLAILDRVISYTPLLEINPDNVYSWLRTGCHYFYCSYNNLFELFSVDKKIVASIKKLENVEKAFNSPDGSLFALVNNSNVNFHIEDSFKLISSYKLNCKILNVTIDAKNFVSAIVTSDLIYFFDILKSELIGTFKNVDFQFLDGKIFLPLHDHFINYDDIRNNFRIENITQKYQNSLCEDGKTAFFDFKNQKIIFNDSQNTFVKSQAYVKNAKFYLAKKRLYALIVKNLGGEDQYLIESYYNKTVTLNSFKNPIINSSFSESMFFILDSEYNLEFYNKEQYNFQCIKSIKKKGHCLLSAKGDMCVVYDPDSAIIEFYDKGVLRSAFNQDFCTDIKWCDSGLYVCVYSSSDNIGCMVQVFNINGLLMFKKIFNSLKDFEWRNFLSIEASLKKEILENNLIEVQEEEEFKDKYDLFSEWKGYLLSKIQDLNINDLFPPNK